MKFRKCFTKFIISVRFVSLPAIVRHVLSVFTNYFKGHLYYWLDFDLTWNDAIMLALFNNCSNGSSSLHI